jgi:hypothetical protein
MGRPGAGGPKSQMDQLGTLFKDYGTLALAVIALLQPRGAYVWKKAFRPGAIDIYETGTIEVGYSGFGPTIGLVGTLRARDRELFVRAASIEIERDADHARHGFEWAAFRTTRNIIGRPIETSFSVPVGFMLTPTQPNRYNIFFNDLRFQTERLVPIAQPLQAAWLAAVAATLGANNANATAAQVAQAKTQTYPGFQNSNAHVHAVTRIGQEFYWAAGWYRLTLRTQTARPDLTFERSWRFQLTDAHSQALRRNSSKIAQEVCEQNVGQYEFAFAQYHPPPA